MEKSNGKEAFLAAVEEAMDFLLIDWEKIDPANPAPAPDDEVGLGEEVVMNMSDNQKVLWTALVQAVDRLKELENKMPAVGRQNATIELLKGLLFFSIDNSIGSPYGESGVGIRKNYKIVVFTPVLFGERELTDVLKKMILGG